MDETSLGVRLIALVLIVAVIALTATFPMLKQKFLGAKKNNKK